MCEKIRKVWDGLDVAAVVNKRELLLGFAVCTLAGMVAGMLCSPKKHVTIGSHNSQVIDKRGLDAADEVGEDEDDEEDVVRF